MEKVTSGKRELLIGIAGLIAGTALFIWSAHLFFRDGIIWPWGLGGGFAFACIGGIRIFCYFDDRRNELARNKRNGGSRQQCLGGDSGNGAEDGDVPGASQG